RAVGCRAGLDGRGETREPVRSLGPGTSRGCARTRGRGRGSPRPRGTASLRFSPARRRDDQPADLWCAEVRSGGCGWYAYTGGRRQAVCRSSREPARLLQGRAVARVHRACMKFVGGWSVVRVAGTPRPRHLIINAEERIGPGGLEPPFPDPKSGVLPLDEGPAASRRGSSRRRCGPTTVARTEVALYGSAEHHPRRWGRESTRRPQAKRSSLSPRRVSAKPPRVC